MPVNSRLPESCSQSMSNISAASDLPLPFDSSTARWRWLGSQQPPPTHQPDPRSGGEITIGFWFWTVTDGPRTVPLPITAFARASSGSV